MVHFCAHKISLKKSTFEDFVKKVTGDKQEKTASTEQVVKTAEADEAETSGQPQAEAKLVNVPKKEEGKKQSGGADNSEAETSGQPQAEAKLVNKPEVKAEEETEVKEAEVEEKEEDTEEVKEEGEEGEEKDAKSETKTKEAAKKCSACNCDPCECKECDKCGKAPCKCEKEAEAKEETKDAEHKPQFVRIAKLNTQTRQWLRDYWLNLFPSDYVDAMLQDK